MYYAKDKRSGAELSAEAAVANRNYACPTCGEDVYARGGLMRVRHFAHRSGRADRNCENYHPGSGIGNPLTPQSEFGRPHGDERVRIDPLALGLRVETPSSVARGDRPRWRLVLTLPKSLTGFGRLRVPTGFRSQSREVLLYSLSQSSQDIEVNPNALRFGAEWISDEVDHAYREVVSDRLDGFAADQAQAFVANTAKAKPLATALVWGDSYYVIWKHDGLAFPEVLNTQSLAPHEGWSAAFITVPPLASNEIAAWLERAFGLRTLDSKRQWGIVYPPPIDVDLDSNVSVSETKCVVLGFVETDDADGAARTLSFATTMTRHEVSTEPGANSIFRVTRDALDVRGPLRLQWGPKHLPSIIAAPMPDAAPPSPAVMIRVRDSREGRVIGLLFHRPEARHALGRIREGEAELIALSVPNGVTGRLERRLSTGLWQPLLALDRETNGLQRSSSWSLSTTELSEIVSTLVDADSDVRLSFGIFGQYTAPAKRRRVTVRPSLSPDTRRRIIWYCRANELVHPNSKRHIGHSPDSELLQLFGRILPLPHLVAHRNLLRKRLITDGSARTIR